MILLFNDGNYNIILLCKPQKSRKWGGLRIKQYTADSRETILAWKVDTFKESIFHQTFNSVIREHHQWYTSLKESTTLASIVSYESECLYIATQAFTN